MKRIDFVFFDAGGGHRSAATALKAVVEMQGRPWNVRLMNLQEVLDEIDIFRKKTGIRMQDIYNRMLANGWTLGTEYLVPVMHAIIRRSHDKQVRMLADFWRADTPDMVVSLVPNFNRAMFEAIGRVNPRIPYVTVTTDFADYPPHFWMERQDQYMICGTERAAAQARDMEYRPERVFLTSGMVLRPAFYEQPVIDVAVERSAIGFEPERPTGILLFGGHGSNVMEKIVRALENCRRELQLVAICGRNERLAERLSAYSTRFPLHVVGFTNEVQRYMAMSDFFIGKPGPGSISEAIAMKLPVIVQSNAWTLPQERYNAEWVREKRVGMVIRNVAEIARAVDELVEPGRLAEYRANVARIDNRAVFEIPDILEQILEQK
jgi:1,2-diacylglycerol 3-beta-galactosyltransferase